MIDDEKAWRLTVQPMLRPAPLRPGQYTLRLWMIDPTSTAAGQRVFDVPVGAGAPGEYYAFDPVRAGYLRLECRGNSENQWNSIQSMAAHARSKPTRLSVYGGAADQYMDCSARCPLPADR